MNSIITTKAIVFDIDDTLHQTIKSKWQAIKATGKKFYQVDITDQKLKRYWGLPFRKLMISLLGKYDNFANIQRHYLEVSSQFPMSAHKNAQKILNYLKTKYVLCALTSSSRKVIIKDFNESKIGIYLFNYIQTSDARFHKPNPNVFKLILKKLHEIGIVKKDIVYIGDSLSDWQTCQAAKIKFIGVTSGLTTKKDFQKAGLPQTLIIDDLSSLAKLLRTKVR